MSYFKVAEVIEGFMKGFVAGSGAKGCVIGLSGGLDSSTVAHLLVRALGKEKVLGLIMPMSGITRQEDLDDAVSLAEDLGINYRIIDIREIFEAYTSANPLFDENDKIANGNLQARIRMTLLYYAANRKNLLVAGTSDRSEILLGYFTKYGDGASDFIPIGDLYKTQVRELARSIGVPDKIVNKPSSPGLWVGQTAEGELGLSYDVIDRILIALFDRKMEIDEAAREVGVSREVVEKVMEMCRNSTHKRSLPPKPSVRILLR